jgi:APA family basic amino acid/polyamine antiporter
MGVLPPASLAASTAPLADAASRMWGQGAASLVAAGAAVSCFGALNGWTLLMGQMPRAAAADGLLPLGFARLNARGAPAPALVVSSVLVTFVVGLNYTHGLVAGFTFIILLSTIATLVAYLFSTAASATAWLRDTARPRRAGPLAVAVLAFAYTAWAVVGAGSDAIFWGLLLLAAGVPVYAWASRRAARPTA